MVSFWLMAEHQDTQLNILPIKTLIIMYTLKSFGVPTLRAILYLCVRIYIAEEGSYSQLASSVEIESYCILSKFKVSNSDRSSQRLQHVLLLCI